MRPDVWPTQPTDPSRWTWKLLHSWELEMRSALTASRWRARSSSRLRTRFVLFIDNQSSLAVLVKSRSSSRKPNAVARETAAILLCTLSGPLYAYTDTDCNHADAGSRKRHATTKSSNCTGRFTPLLVSCSTRSRNIACSLVVRRDLHSNCVCSCVRTAVTKMQSPLSPPGFVMKATLHLTKMLSCTNILSGSGTKELLWVGQATRSAVVSFFLQKKRHYQAAWELCRTFLSLDRMFLPSLQQVLHGICRMWPYSLPSGTVVFCERWKRLPCNVTNSQHKEVAFF